MSPKRSWDKESNSDNKNTIIIQNQNVQENSGYQGGCLQGCGTVFGMFVFLGFILALTEKFGPVVMLLVGFVVGVCGGAMIHGFISGKPVPINQLPTYIEESSDAIEENKSKEWKDWDPELKQQIYFMLGFGVACALGGLIYAQST